MPTLETLVYQTGRFGPFLMVVIAVFLLLETTMLSLLRRSRAHQRINARLTIQDRNVDNATALHELRRNRGLGDGTLDLSGLGWLQRLVMQSGLSMPPGQLVMLLAMIAGAAAVITVVLLQDLFLAVLLALAAGGLIPLLLLMYWRAKRRRQFEDQLPEAIDVMVRSLRAGHPIPIAINMNSALSPTR